ncbi:hypothetical protein ABZP36_013292 [Zizania latifolia]
MDHLRHLLSAEERQATNLVEVVWRKPPENQQPTEAEQHGGGKKPREKGNKHATLVVHIVVNRVAHEMELTRWDSNGHTVLKGKELSKFLDSGTQPSRRTTRSGYGHSGESPTMLCI